MLRVLFILGAYLLIPMAESASNKEKDPLKSLPPMNIIYSSIVSYVNNMIPTLTNLHFKEYGVENGSFYLQDISLSGLEKTTFILIGASSGFNIENFTLILPKVDIEVGFCRLPKVDFYEYFTINTGGAIKVSFENLVLSTKLNMRYKGGTRSFMVTSIPEIRYKLGKTRMEVGPLLGINDLLAVPVDVFLSQFIPYAMTFSNQKLQEFRQPPHLWEKVEALLNPLISRIINTSVKTILGS